MDSDRALSPSAVEDAAAALDAAERSRTQIGQLSQSHPGMTMADAYAVQDAWVARKLNSGRVICGYKVGLTSYAMQMAVNVHEPDSGVLLDDMQCDDGGDVDIARFIAPRIEAELAFVLRTSLRGPGCTVFDVLNATDFVAPAIEILDARIQRVDPATKRTRTVLDTVSDNAANAAFVLGPTMVRPEAADLRWAAAICHRNGRIEETGVAAGVLGNPARAVVWLANRLGTLGRRLEAGHTVLSGSFIRPIDIAKGDVVHIEYAGMSSVGCRFT